MTSNKYKAEAFDIMQYFYGTVHNPLIHCQIKLSSHLDEAVLKAAVFQSALVIPIIGCRFVTQSGRPYWQKAESSLESIVVLAEAEHNEDDQIQRFLASPIDIANGPQLKIIIVRKPENDTLCIIMNHMVCDGAGFKEYLYLLCDLYNKYRKKEASAIQPNNLQRGTKQLFERFRLLEKWRIFALKYDTSVLKEQAYIYFQGDKDNPLFITRQINKETFLQLKRAAKENDSTINDLMLTAYARILYKKTGSERICIPCPVDLRKYRLPTSNYSICNLTSNYFCDVTIHEQDSFIDTLNQISNQIKRQKSSLHILKSVMLAEAAFRFVPFHTMTKQFHNLFHIPVISFTNLGSLDKAKLVFEGTAIQDVYLTGAIKTIPYFQIAISTFDDCCTISCNMYGTREDKIQIESFLTETAEEINSIL